MAFMAYWLVVFLLVGASIGFIIGAESSKYWGKWKDIVIVYDSTEFQWNMLQAKESSDGTKKFRTIKIVKYAQLTNDDQKKIAEMFYDGLIKKQYE